MIEAIVYFRGPLTNWAQKVDADEVLIRRRFRLRWLARLWARNLYGQFNTARVGWAILEDGDQVEGSDVIPEAEALP